MRGGVLSSGMEYPGRYSRWHLAYVNPCAELVARGRRISARALNARGEVLLPVLAAALLRVGEPGPAAVRLRQRSRWLVPEPAGVLAEEDRSRRPTVFSALREVVADHGRRRSAPGAVRRVRLRPRVPVRAGRAAPPAAQRGGATWCCTCPTSSTCSTASAKRPSGTGMTSRWRAPPPAACPARHRPPRLAARMPRRGPSQAARNPAPMPASSSGPGSGSSTATCSRSCPATPSTHRAPPRPPSTSGCGGATRLPTSSSSTSGEGECLVGASPGDVRAGHRGPGGDLPDLRHDPAGRRPAGGRRQHPCPARLGQG